MARDECELADIIFPEFTRLREKNGDFLTKVYKPLTLKAQGFSERKNLVVEPFSLPLESQQLLIYVTRIDTKTLQLEPARELIVNKKSNLQEIGAWAVTAGIDIPLNDLVATKIRDVRGFVVEDVLAHRFFHMNREDKLVSGSPFYLETDGCLFIFKHRKDFFEKEPNVPHRNTGQSFKKREFRGAEKQLKIYVKKTENCETELVEG